VHYTPVTLNRFRSAQPTLLKSTPPVYNTNKRHLKHVHTHIRCLPLACQINCRLLNLSSALIFKVLQCHSKLVEMVSGYETALIRVLGVSSRSKLFAYGTLVVLGGLTVNLNKFIHIKVKYKYVDDGVTAFERSEVTLLQF